MKNESPTNQEMNDALARLDEMAPPLKNESPTSQEMNDASARLDAMALCLMNDEELIERKFTEKKKVLMQGYAYELINCLEILRNHLKDPANGVSKKDGFVLTICETGFFFSQVDTASDAWKNHELLSLPNPCGFIDLNGLVLYDIHAVGLAKKIHYGLTVVADTIRRDIHACKREEVFLYFIE